MKDGGLGALSLPVLLVVGVALAMTDVPRVDLVRALLPR
jgi:hypothetical protein